MAAYYAKTVPVIPADKKLNDLDGTISQSNIINCCKFVEEYYDGMPSSDIVNRNVQFLLGVEEAVQTTRIFKKHPFPFFESILQIILHQQYPLVLITNY